MGYAIETIEDAILAALEASTLATTCKTIDTYHGEIDDLVKELKQLIIPLPATFVLYAGSRFTEPANRSYDDEQYYTIVCIAKDLRGRESLRTGIYDILEIIKATLIDSNLGLDIEPLHPVTIEATMITQQFSLYSFDIKTSFSLD
jgi:phage gp37-like protein